MTLKTHLQIATIATVAWSIFFIIGIPFDYFQTWSLNEQILLTFFAFFALFPILSGSTIILINHDYLRTSIWFSLYGSMLPAVFDFIICGIVQRRGLSYIVSHWYLSAAYVYIWFVVPMTGLALKTFTAQLRATAP